VRSDGRGRRRQRAREGKFQAKGKEKGEGGGGGGGVGCIRVIQLQHVLCNLYIIQLISADREYQHNP
jgi:hypothetical protein